MFKVISQDTLANERRSQTVEQDIPFLVAGEQEVVKKRIVNGEMEVAELPRALGEMINYGSISDLKDLLRKVALDVEMGREQVQTLYQPIYDTLVDANFPEVLDAKWAMHGNCVFLEHLEGDEVKFGSVEAEHGPVARIKTFTTGFEYTKKMVDFNESFGVEMLNKAIGEAYNALLNHIHLSPILSYNYKAANKTAFTQEAGEPRWVSIYKTITEAVKRARSEKRPGTVLIANSVDQTDIEMALKGGHQIKGTVYPPIPGITTVIYYDGYDVRVGEKDYSYEGVEQGEVFLVRPKRGFKELIKRELTIEKGNADISRLVEEQIVAHCYRGVFAAVEENVQKISIQ